MYEEQVKLIAIDVDGTLLDSRHCLTPRTAEVLTEVQKLGVTISLATGKILPSVVSIISELRLSAPLILANGAVLQHPSGRILCKRLVSETILEAAIAVSSRFGVDLAIYTPTDIFVCELNYNTHLVVEYGEPMPTEVGNWKCLHDIRSDICKLLLINRYSSVALSTVETELKRILAEEAKTHWSVPSMLEITSSEATKSKALRILAWHLDLQMEETMAIGDNFNDIDMFGVVGLSVAMGNAPEDVKRAAQVVIGTNDSDGVARFLERTLLRRS